MVIKGKETHSNRNASKKPAVCSKSKLLGNAKYCRLDKFFLSLKLKIVFWIHNEKIANHVQEKMQSSQLRYEKLMVKLFFSFLSRPHYPV